MSYKKYIKQWQDATIQMNEAIQKNDFQMADKLMLESEKAYNRYKECTKLPALNEKKSFGELHALLEQRLADLYLNDKEVMKECLNFIKKDKNLINEFKFIDALRNYGCEGNAREYVSESLELIASHIDRKTLNESNRKFAQFLAEKEIGLETIDESAKAFYSSCDKILREEKKINNLTSYNNTLNEIANYIQEHKVVVKESKPSFKELCEKLDQKLNLLSEEDRTLVQDIIDFKQPMVEQNQQKLFNSFKKECLTAINELKSKQPTQDELQSLELLESQILNKEYNKATIVQDFAKLLEIRDVLMEP